jgi:DNA repair protein RadC
MSNTNPVQSTILSAVPTTEELMRSIPSGLQHTMKQNSLISQVQNLSASISGCGRCYVQDMEAQNKRRTATVLSIPGRSDIRYKVELNLYPVATEYKLTLNVGSSVDAANIVQWIYAQKPEEFYKEHFYVLMFNRANKFLSYQKLSTGGTSGTVVDVKLIFHMLLLHNANGFILAHNHPSGNPKPSEQDVQLTRKIKEVARVHEISLLDHIIVCDLHGNFYSFADEGTL